MGYSEKRDLTVTSKGKSDEPVELNEVDDQSLFAIGNPRKRISSTVFDSVFIPSKAISLHDLPGADVEAISRGEKPWVETTISKPYWRDRGFEKLNVGVYGAIPTTDDRHILDCIIAIGVPLNKERLRGASIRDVLWSWEKSTSEKLGSNKDSEFDQKGPEFRSSSLPSSIPLELLPTQTIVSLDNSVFSEDFVYFVLPIKSLWSVLGVTRGESNKNQLIAKLERLALVTLRITPLNDLGQPLDKVNSRLLAPYFYPFCDTTNIRNKKILSHNSFNHIIVGVGATYYASLKKDATIPRSKIIKQYMGLKNSAHMLDFIKHLEKNRVGYFSGYSVKKVCQKYLEGKILYSTAKDQKRVMSNKVNSMIKILTSNKNGLVESLEDITGYTLYIDKNDNKTLRFSHPVKLTESEDQITED